MQALTAGDGHTIDQPSNPMPWHTKFYWNTYLIPSTLKWGVKKAKLGNGINILNQVSEINSST